jgi:hypothetical protein
MKTRTNVLALGACVLAGSALAGEKTETFEMPAPPPGHAGLMIHGPIEGFEARVVKGAPYSAESVTEMTQTLADGNRIVRTMGGSVARDGEGRTRREQTLGALGPFMADKAPRTAFLNDPVAGVHYVLQLDAKVANKMPAFKGEAGAHQVMHFQKRIVVNGAEVQNVDEDTVTASGPGEDGAPAKESLGEKTIEGVTAEGTRSVITIAAGKIGNDRPIEITDERWYSPQLQAVVLSRHLDPRYGETTYRLTHIERDEPDASLFTVPADFTVKEGPGSDVMFIRRHAQD